MLLLTKKGRQERPPNSPKHSFRVSPSRKKGTRRVSFSHPTLELTGPHRSILFRFLALKDYYGLPTYYYTRSLFFRSTNSFFVLLTESAVEKSSFILTLHTRAQNSGTLRFSFFLFSLGPPAFSAREKEFVDFFESRVGRVGRVDQKKGGCDARIFVSSSKRFGLECHFSISKNSAERKEKALRTVLTRRRPTEKEGRNSANTVRASCDSEGDAWNARSRLRARYRYREIIL